MICRIAVVQMQIRWRDPDANLKQMERDIRRAKRARADVVVFPEYALMGDIPDRSHPSGAHQKFLRRFSELARNAKLDLVPGTMAERVGSVVYNTAYYIDWRGRVLHRYRKINLWHPERGFVSPGTRVSVFKTRFGRAGLTICWDLMFPQVFQTLMKKEVSLVYCPSYWSAGDAGKGLLLDPYSEEKLIDAACVTRAFENEIVFAYANPAGDHTLPRRETPLGHSQITMPFRGAIGRLAHRREGLLVRSVDLSVLRLAERVYKIRADHSDIG